MSEHQNNDALLQSLSKIGKNETARSKLIASLRDIEKDTMRDGFDAREQITGPIVDAMFNDQTLLHKTLEDGLEFDYLYRSKIAREILLAPANTEDHVWEPQTTKLLKLLSQTDRDVLIGGAYAGDQAIFVAHTLKKYGNGKCHCFEPNTSQRDMLKHNANKNNLTNLTANPEGLWKNDDASMKLVGDDSFACAEITTDSPDENHFRTTSIDIYLTRNRVDELALIMLDIEGGELAALEGAKKQLKKPPSTAPTVVFEVHRDYVDWSNGLENTAICELLKDHGYQLYAIRDFNSSVAMKGMPIELIPAESAYLEGPPHGFNMLAVKDRGLIENDHFRICYNVSPKLLWHRDKVLHLPSELQQ